MKCQASAQYGKDELKRITFYCNFCGRGMFMDEDRECMNEPDKCPKCGKPIGSDEWSVGLDTCFDCDKVV